jgi:diguanylate cyclase (GGDEF)-like protein
MTRRLDAKLSRKGISRRLVALAVAVLGFAAISAWCVYLLAESLPLRRQLHRHLEWVADLQALRASLAHTFAEGAGGSTHAADRLLALTEEWQRESVDSAVRTAAIELSHRLETLAALHRQPLASVSPEAWSDAVFAASRGADRMEIVLQPQVLELNQRLDDHWSSLNVLLVITLLLSAVSLYFLFALERRGRELEKARDRAAQLLTHDVLTGLLNRDGVLRLLRHELQRCRRRREALSLLIADVDRFREINVLVGEEQGDVLLQQVAQRLGTWVRPYDSIGRIGADAFLILLPGCDHAAVIGVAERLREVVEKEDIVLERSRVHPSVSIAYTTLDPPEEHDAELLLYRLREALDRVQRGQRGLVEVTVDGTGPVPLASANTIELLPD